ncbi:hypothetical protein JEZ13_12380 [bacterium]|nr:hypothetical protein [bacterium]
MNKKRFLVKYIYKGKQVTVAWSEGNENTSKFFLLGNKLTIGSDPTLLWQIFNPAFPKKHDLIIKENQDYYINLLKSFSIQVNKDGKELGLDELKSLGLLKDNRLYLKDDFNGSIIIDDKTTITFNSFPKPAPLNPEQLKLVALLTRYPKATGMNKFTKYSVVLVILFLIGFASIIGWTYTPPPKENIFSMTEREMTVAIPVRRVDTSSQVATYEEVATDTEADVEEAPTDQEAQAVADRQALTQRAAQRAAQRRETTTTAQRYTGGQVASVGGQAGTGEALGVKSRLKGLQGSSRASSSFSNLDVDTSSEYGDIARSLARQKDDQLGTAVVSARGVSADQIRGRKTASIGSEGGANLGEIASNIGDGYAVQTIEGEDVDGTGLETGKIQARKREVVKLSDTQKDNQLTEWFTNAILPRINQEYDKYKLRKSIRGELIITLIFQDGKIIRANIRGLGSINDREFISTIKNLLEKRSTPPANIGTYQFTVKPKFE